MLIFRVSCTLMLCVAVSFACQAQRSPHNGFDVSNSVIPVEEIVRGGPPRDGIPAILRPEFVAYDDDQGLRDSDLVISFTHNGDTRAYPLKILVWHEIVNDTVGGLPVIITYCPLCGTSMVFERTVGGGEKTFGVSGLLYNSDVLMYDHQTESLWSQLKMSAVAGPLVRTELTWLPSTEMTLGAWRAANPGGRLLSTRTGHGRDYSREAYTRYKRSAETMFPVPFARTELKKKDWVLGVIVNDVAKAYRFEDLERAEDGALSDQVGDTPIRIRYADESGAAEVTKAGSGEPIPHVRLYWFAWQAFYPETELYGAGR